MKIAVFGATGATGQQFVQHALGRHEVTVLVRSPEKLPTPHDGLQIVKGDALSADDLRRTVQGQDAVFFALGTGENTQRSTVRTDSTRLLLNVLQTLGETPHLVVLSSLAAGESRYQIGLALRLMLRYVLRHVLADHEGQEALVRGSALPWTILRPTSLNNDASAGGIQATLPPGRIRARPSVSRADVAAFALEVIQNKRYIQQAVTLSAR